MYKCSIAQVKGSGQWQERVNSAIYCKAKNKSLELYYFNHIHKFY